MDIYDVLRKLVEARGFQQYEQAEALTVIEDCRRLNVFGTTAKQARQDHEHDWIQWGPARWRCSICGQESNEQHQRV